MSKIIPIILVILTILILGALFFFEERGTSQRGESDIATTTTINSDVFGIAFTYPDNYTVVENPRLEGETTTFRFGYTLYRTDEYEDLINSPDGREAPAAITISIYDNPLIGQSEDWGSAMAQFRNWGTQQPEPTETTVGGQNAVRFTADGLYPSDNYIVTSGEFVYVLTGAYLTPQDDIVTDFANIVTSIVFTPPVAE